MCCAQVDDHLRVEGHANWFAIGDCNNLPEVKLGYQAKMQALEVKQALQTIVKEGDKAVLARHKPYTGLNVRLRPIDLYLVVVSVA